MYLFGKEPEVIILRRAGYKHLEHLESAELDAYASQDVIIIEPG